MKHDNKSNPSRRASGPQDRIAHPRAEGPKDRKRGGQPGNTNAMKHGFYSDMFKQEERRILSEIPLDDLSAEIELLRVTNRRFLDALIASKDRLDFDTQLTALRAVNLSAHSIATLLRAHALGTLARHDMGELPLPVPSDLPR